MADLPRVSWQQSQESPLQMADRRPYGKEEMGSVMDDPDRDSRRQMVDLLGILSGLPGAEVALAKGLGGLGAVGAISPKLFVKSVPEFSSSTIVDKLGDLMPLYHGGPGLEKGMPNKGTGVLGEGLYLTGSPTRAGGYPLNPDGRTTYQVYANLKNPISSDEFTARFTRGLTSAKNAKQITEQLKKEGYDGVVDKDKTGQVWEAVSFYPDRDILSAISGVNPAKQVKAKDDLYREMLEQMIR